MNALVWTCAYLATAGLVAFKQRELGDFSVPSALAYPVFTLLFIGVSMLVACDAILRRPVMWRGRKISMGSD